MTEFQTLMVTIVAVAFIVAVVATPTLLIVNGRAEAAGRYVLADATKWIYWGMVAVVVIAAAVALWALLAS